MGLTNFLVTRSAASLPKMTMRIRTYEDAVLYTQCHDPIQLGWPEFNHDGVGVAVYDLCVMCMTVCDTVLCLNFLDRSKKGITQYILHPHSRSTHRFRLLNHLSTVGRYTRRDG